MRRAEKQREIMVHYGVRLPPALFNRLVHYAAKNRITPSEGLRRLLEISLKTSQRR